MSNINKITDSEKLFVELTHEEGASISGGFNYVLRNRSDAIFPYTFNGIPDEVGPLSEKPISSPFNQAVLANDKIIGPGYQLDARVIEPGVTTIDRQGNMFLVIPAGTAGVPPAAATV